MICLSFHRKGGPGLGLWSPGHLPGRRLPDSRSSSLPNSPGQEQCRGPCLRSPEFGGPEITGPCASSPLLGPTRRQRSPSPEAIACSRELFPGRGTKCYGKMTQTELWGSEVEFIHACGPKGRSPQILGSGAGRKPAYIGRGCPLLGARKGGAERGARREAGAHGSRTRKLAWGLMARQGFLKMGSSFPVTKPRGHGQD